MFKGFSMANKYRYVIDLVFRYSVHLVSYPSLCQSNTSNLDDSGKVILYK